MNIETTRKTLVWWLIWSVSLSTLFAGVMIVLHVATRAELPTAVLTTMAAAPLLTSVAAGILRQLFRAEENSIRGTLIWWLILSVSLSTLFAGAMIGLSAFEIVVLPTMVLTTMTAAPLLTSVAVGILRQIPRTADSESN